MTPEEYTARVAEQLAEIRARAEAATPGPWMVATPWAWEDGPWRVKEARTWRPDEINNPHWGEITGDLPSEANAVFIASARTDILRLLEYIATLEANR